MGKNENIDREKIGRWISGWNSWNHFHRNISEKLIQQTADALVSTGLAAAGYQYGLLIFFFLVLSYLFSSQSR